MSAIAQFERDVLADRTREGLTSAREHKGGRPTTNNEKIRKVIKLYKSGEYTVKQITEMIGVRRSTLYNYLSK